MRIKRGRVEEKDEEEDELGRGKGNEGLGG